MTPEHALPAVTALFVGVLLAVTGLGRFELAAGLLAGFALALVWKWAWDAERAAYAGRIAARQEYRPRVYQLPAHEVTELSERDLDPELRVNDTSGGGAWEMR